MSRIFRIFLFLFITHNLCLQAQDSVSVNNKIYQKYSEVSNKIVEPKTNQTLDTLALPNTDTLFQKKTSRLVAEKDTLQMNIDSLKQKGVVVKDSINRILNLPQEQINKLNSYPKDLSSKIKESTPAINKVDGEKNKIKDGVAEVQDVANDLGVGPIGNDINPLNTNTNINLPQNSQSLPSISNEGLAAPSMNSDLNLTSALPAQNLPDAELNPLKNIKAPAELTNTQESVKEITGTVSEVNTVINQGTETIQQVNDISKEGLRSENVDAMVENQAKNIDGLSELQSQQAQMDQYKALIEQYKKEQAIKAELQEKSKEVANDIFEVEANRKKIDESVARFNKTKKKLPKVKRPSIQLEDSLSRKKINWRSVVVPGLVFQTINTSRLWVQLDPQIKFKITPGLAGGFGYLYRFSMNASNLTFSHFNTLQGEKIFVQANVFKGFALLAEGQRIHWFPELQPKHPDSGIERESFTALAGIARGQTIGKRIKANAQALYHYTWGDDPYKSKIVLRVAFDFNLEKREKRPWELKLKELRKKK